LAKVAKIFISHSGLDQKFAEDFASELRKYDHEPTGDIGMTVTQDWDTELLKALSESDVVVFLFTQNAVGSENILGEVGSAKALCNFAKKPHLLPVVFPGGSLPKPLSRVQAQMLSAAPTATVLGAQVNSLIAKLPIDSRTPLGDVFAPEKITFPWLWDHVSVGYWITLLTVLLGIIGTTFTLGFKAGQTPEFARFFGGKELPPAVVQSRPLVVAGTVVDQSTKLGVGQATISLAGRTETYVTEDNGNFRIELRGQSGDNQRVRIHATKDGYQAADESATPTAENLIIQLKKL
jgi:TIR domain-containing protein